MHVARCNIFTHLQGLIRSASRSVKPQPGLDSTSANTTALNLLQSVDTTFTMLNRAYLGDKDAIHWLEQATSLSSMHNKDMHMLARAGLLVLQREEQGAVKSGSGGGSRDESELLTYLLAALNQIDPATAQYSQMAWFLGLCYRYDMG
ncbi:hypothetical protein EON63_17505 [archaeon]|nr:MAG: hypothetical protein EON63_17505 [archaeon]